MAELTEVSVRFLLTPLREGRPRRFPAARQRTHFYSRPCGRGDVTYIDDAKVMELISTHAPAGGATYGFEVTLFDEDYYFYSRPCGRGDQKPEVRTIRRYISTHAPAGGATRVCHHRCRQNDNFYSRPCGRGDNEINIGQRHGSQFLLTPLREGRQVLKRLVRIGTVFLLTPLREGRHNAVQHVFSSCEISTHAPAGGATAIFHKSVMRFCGKLPKDDTVLCLASFGFPRRDPKAVYLAWISCANLPQKCVRQGLALKDQGTSCFHEGLASHAFDPVLV